MVFMVQKSLVGSHTLFVQFDEGSCRAPHHSILKGPCVRCFNVRLWKIFGSSERDYCLPEEVGFGVHFLLECVYLEVRFTYNLLSNCSYNPIISRVTVVMGFTIGL